MAQHVPVAFVGVIGVKGEVAHLYGWYGHIAPQQINKVIKQLVAQRQAFAALAHLGTLNARMKEGEDAKRWFFEALKQAHAAEPRLRVIRFRRNFGQTAAFAAGFDHARGEWVITIDADLQNDPADIPAMIVKAEEGYDIVSGWRQKRKDAMIIRKLPSKAANWLIRRVTGVMIHDYGCSLKVYHRDVAKNLNLYGELHRFIPVLAKLQGANITQVDVKHHHRKFGKSKYGINRTFKVMSDLVLMVFMRKYMQKPMHLFGTMGFIALGLGALINLYLLVIKLMGKTSGANPSLYLA